jgi:phosphoglycerate dehydrogenase-like enzyme
VATKIVFAPKMPDPIMDTARSMIPEGFEMVVTEHDDPDFLKHVAGAEYYIGFPRAGMGEAFFKAGSGLKLVQLISAGYDRIDVPAAKRAGVPIANNGGSNSVAVAEHTLMLILAVYKKMAWHHINVTHGKWRIGDFSTTRTYELAGKKLGIVGLGTIGKKVVRRAVGFDMDIQYYDIVRLTEDQEDALGVKFTLFPELLQTSDVVSLHVPLNDATRKMMGAREFAMMQKDAIFINTCRGPVVDEEALRHALLSKQISAAGLDVMVEEPPLINHPLFGLENVTFTPHSAGPTWENWTKAFRNAFDNVQRVARGEKPLWVIPELR